MNMDITEFARLGGRARALKLTGEERVRIARKAGKASGKARKAKANLHRGTAHIYGENASGGK